MHLWFCSEWGVLPGIHHPGRHPTPADTPHPSRQLLQRMVGILLECILVTDQFGSFQFIQIQDWQAWSTKHVLFTCSITQLGHTDQNVGHVESTYPLDSPTPDTHRPHLPQQPWSLHTPTAPKPITPLHPTYLYPLDAIHPTYSLEPTFTLDPRDP